MQMDDEILALSAAWLAGYVVSCWHSGIVLGDIILHADGSIETKAPEVWQLLDAPVVVDRPCTAPAGEPPLAQPLRAEDDLHRLLASEGLRQRCFPGGRGAGAIDHDGSVE